MAFQKVNSVSHREVSSAARREREGERTNERNENIATDRLKIDLTDTEIRRKWAEWERVQKYRQ